MVRLSVVVITLNEAHNLPRLLNSLSDLADDVVVFDSGSTDGTVAIAKAHGARVYPCQWEGWSSTKNRANQAAIGEWTLSLDADEALTETSREAIRRHMTGPVQNEKGEWRAAEINRLTRYCGNWVHHSGWHPDRKIRLWPTGSAHWEGSIHERARFQGTVSVARIAGHVEHHSYPCAADHLKQIERFGKVWAEDQLSLGHRYPMALALVKVAAQWLKSFVIKRGVLDGRTGWTIARRSAWATWRKHARLQMLQAGGPTVPSRVLIARTDAIGDLILTLPLVRALKDRFPNVEVDLLVRNYAAPVARQAQGVNRVIEWTSAMADDPQRTGMEAILQGGYDVVVHAFPDQGVMRAAARAGIPRRIASGRRWAGIRYATIRCWDSRKASGGHEAWHGLRLLLALGVDSDETFRRETGLIAPVAKGPVFPTMAGMNAPPILLHPGSNGSAGNWAPERFAELAVKLAEIGHVVGLTGTTREQASFAPHLLHHPRVVDLFGQLDLNKLMALQAQSALVVASSTGPLHTAAALGTPCLGLYGKDAPEWPQRWAPLGPSVKICVSKTFTVSGHLDLAVDEVLAACIPMLNATDPKA
mgnify:CR=1 FL=1